jgi:ribonuclease P protein component
LVGLNRLDRLLQRDVVKLLRQGAQLTRGEFAIKILENGARRGRIAIAVPKRVLNSAVDRNRVKRVIREEFRLHAIKCMPIDLLVTLRSRAAILPAECGSHRREKQKLRQTLAQLLGDVVRRFDMVVQ